jgi:hypothetical protein
MTHHLRTVPLAYFGHTEDPPPCNEHYLMSCSKGVSTVTNERSHCQSLIFFSSRMQASCKYSHDYMLTQEQLATLAGNAKKAPCNWLKNGLQCPYGDRCCWGHTCPSGAKCFHLSKGKCWFKGGQYPSIYFKLHTHTQCYRRYAFGLSRSGRSEPFPR